MLDYKALFGKVAQIKNEMCIIFHRLERLEKVVYKLIENEDDEVFSGLKEDMCARKDLCSFVKSNTEKKEE